jgi:zinc transport system substrate-binding protein
VRYSFEAIGEPAEGMPQYIMFSDHQHEPSPTEHFHIYASDVGFDELMAETDPVQYPTYYSSDLSDEELVAEMIEHESEYDEHVWTSPVNAKIIVQALSQILCDLDSGNASVYEANTASYVEKLDELDSAFREVVSNSSRRTIVFGDRFPFRYFADEYGLAYFAAFPGCSTETEANAATVAFLIDKVRDENIPVVFHIEMANENMADAICEEGGAQKLLLHSCHNVSKDDFDRGLGYLELMTQNVDTLREALN